MANYSVPRLGILTGLYPVRGCVACHVALIIGELPHLLRRVTRRERGCVIRSRVRGVLTDARASEHLWLTGTILVFDG